MRESGVRFGRFETMRVEGGVVLRLEAHLARLERSARATRVPLDLAAARRTIEDALRAAPDAPLLRLRLDHDDEGTCTATARPFSDDDDARRVVVLSSIPIDADHPRQRHKTTDRQHYDEATAWARGAGVADVLFRNQRGTLAEGAISTLFVRRGAHLRTPNLADGALPGVLRGELVATGAALEASLTVDDLERGALLGSALRGLRAVFLDPTRSWPPS